MRSCRACGREFGGRSGDCPFCGFNNAAKGGPRSSRSLNQMALDRQDREDFEQELAELTEEFAAWLRWTEAAGRRERTLA